MEPSNQPLAEKLRPTTLDEVVGQSHLIGPGKIINQIIVSGQPASLIFWGPPGSGKTTLARIMAKDLGTDFVELSAVTSGKADIIKVVARAEQNQRLGMSTILFVDEIHRFNKAQQDAFLPHVERGTISLIGATTENPSFSIITPLLSRSRVVVLEALSSEDVITLLNNAAKRRSLNFKRLPKESRQIIAQLSGGDARVALGTLELALQLSGNKSVTPKIIMLAAQTKVPGYDKSGDAHYNLISAFIKSMRGGDVTAALYYMARMLQVGEDPRFVARRMVVFASEDIGLAGNGALSLAVATYNAIEKIGLPEAEYGLYHCAVALTKSAKSRLITNTMAAAKELATNYPDLPVPLHLRNAPTKLMKDLGYGKKTKWTAGFEHPLGFLPPELAGTDILKE